MGRGCVIDDRQQGVPNARIELIQSGRLMRASQGDSRGSFDFYVAPGAYTLAIVPPSDWKPPDPQPDDTGTRAWVRVYYPGVTTPEAASKIVLAPGADFSVLEMKLRPVPAHAIRGVILRPDGTPAPNVSISVEDASTATLVESNSDGAFEFPAVVDGAFRVSAAVENNGVTLRISQSMEMAGRDLDG